MRAGFTLMELLLVMAIIIIVMGIAVVNFDSAYDEAKLNTAADTVRSAWAQARTQAIESGSPFRFSVMPNTGRYRIAPDQSTYWSGSAVTSDASGGGTANVAAEGSLPEQIVFDTGSLAAEEPSANDGGEWQTVLLFLPDGSASADREITLRYKNARPVQVRIRALTGSVTVRTMQSGGAP